jgi:predicted nucleic acid-binding protein
MPRFVVDTDVFIDHLRASQRVPVTPHDAGYSSLTRAELYAGRNADEGSIDLLLGAFEEIGVTRAVAEEAGRLRRTLGIALADAVVAATALTSGSVLVTRNRRHYERVPKLKLHGKS